MRLNAVKTTVPAIVTTVLVVASSGCDSDFGRPRVRTETLPNGATRITNPAEGRWREDETWHLRKLFTLGAVEGDSAEIFGSIADIEVGSDGRIYVLDRQSMDLRIFSADGKYIRSTGRAGEGPGEFGSPNGLERLPAGDSLLVADPRLGRYSILDRDGNFVRSTQRPLNSYGWMMQGGFANGRFYEHGVWRTPTGSENGLVGVKLGAQAELADTMRLPKPPASRIEPFQIITERSHSYMTVPFTPAETWYLTSDGSWWGYGGEYRLLHLGLKGDTLREVVVEGANAQPVTDADLTKWAEGSNVKSFQERGGAIDMSRIPKHKPYFTDIYADKEGNLWVDMPSSDGLTTFDVFDKEGRRLGQLATGVKRDPTVKPRVQNNKLYLAGQDDTDVPVVYVFAIERGRK